MDQQFSDELRVLSAIPLQVGCRIELENTSERRTFTLAFEETGGILVMIGADDLTRWLRGQGKLWALSGVRDVAQRVRDGEPLALPLLLGPN